MQARTAMLGAVMLFGCDHVFGLGDPYQDAMLYQDAMAGDGTGSVTFVSAACTKVSSNSFNITLANAQSGDVLIADVTDAGALQDSLIISDDHGSTFTQLTALSFYQQARVFYLADIPGGATTLSVMPGPGSSVGPQYRFCITEYSGAASDPIAGFTTNKLGNGVPGPETVVVADTLAAPDRGLIHIAAFDGRGVQLHGGATVDVRAASVPEALVEDSSMTIDSTTTLATLDSTSVGTFSEWVVMAVALQAR